MNRFRCISGRHPCTGVLLLALCCIPAGLMARLSELTAGGYLKDLVACSETAAPDSSGRAGQWQNTTQVRLNLRFYPAESVTAAVESRHLMVLQRNVGEGTGSLGSAVSQGDHYFDLAGESANRNSVLTTAVDRLYVDWTYRSLEATAGRQRIAWGTCLVWNPIDLFNPYSVLDFDYEEKPGTDAFRIQVYTGAVSTIEAAGVPGRTGRQTTFGVRYVASLWQYDLSIVGGWERRFWRMGAGWAGQIAGGGFRGEALYSRPGETIEIGPTSGPGSPYGQGGNDRYGAFSTLALSYDYTFRNSLYLHSELLYNGLGTTDNAGLRWAETVVTGELSPARHSIFQELAYDITPLLRCDIFAILNPDDRSWTCISSLAYAFSANWEIIFFAIPSGGKRGSEFGGIPDQAALRIRFDF
jgi:hypothetical protein